MQSIFEINVNSFGCRPDSPSNDKSTNRFSRSAMSVHLPDAFSPYDRIGENRDMEILSACLTGL